MKPIKRSIKPSLNLHEGDEFAQRTPLFARVSVWFRAKMFPDHTQKGREVKARKVRYKSSAPTSNIINPTLKFDLLSSWWRPSASKFSSSPSSSALLLDVRLTPLKMFRYVWHTANRSFQEEGDPGLLDPPGLPGRPDLPLQPRPWPPSQALPLPYHFQEITMLV